MKYSLFALLLLLGLPSAALAADDGMLARTSGHVLLQVESHGEAWYVNPNDGYRYYMKDGATAYEMMRAFGLGITNSDLESVQQGNITILERLKGHILLQVEEHGEAYYVHPTTGEAIYMPDGDAAYEIMRFHSLGISNSDLSRLTAKEFTALPGSTTLAQSEPVAGDVLGVDSEDFVLADVAGEMPEGLNVGQLNTFWLNEVNNVRRSYDVETLSYDPDLLPGATSMAEELIAKIEDDRYYADEMMFSEEPTEPWNSVLSAEHVFTINVDEELNNAQQEMEQVLATLIENEYPTRHKYITIRSPHWSAAAISFYFVSEGDGRYTVYSVHQYAR